MNVAALVALMALEMGAMPSPEIIDRYEAGSYTVAGKDGKSEVFQYRLLKPEKIEPGKKYPLVVFLHGAGERGDDNKNQLAYLPSWLSESERRQKYPCFLLAPQCPQSGKWSDVSWGAKDSIPLGDISLPMQAVVGEMDQLIKEQPIDTSRIYLTGLSMGGYGSWDLGERMPERFAAIAPICGGGDESQAKKLVGVPLWAWHGDADNAVPVDRSRKMIAAIKAAGGDPKYTELAGVGHDSWSKAYTDPEGLLPWLFSQAKADAAKK